MKNVLFIAGADLWRHLRRRETLFWVFVMPLVFFFFFGTITGGKGDGGKRKPRIVLSVGEDPGFLLERLETRLRERDLDVVRSATAEEFAAAGLRLAIPPHFTQRVLGGEATALTLGGQGDGLEGDASSLQVKRAAYTVLADVIATSELSGAVTTQALEALDQRPRALTVVSSQAGDRRVPPQGFEQTIPGTMTMMTLIIMLTSGAIGLLVERREGLLRRLAFAPMSRGEIVLGKWLANLGLGVVQLVWSLVAGAFLFHVNWGPSLPMIGVVLLCWAALGASLGLLSGALARTEGQAVGIGVLLSNLLAGLGGCWWPIEITPKPMQTLAACLPTGWTMEALHKLVSFGLPAASVLPQIGLLLALTAVVSVLAVRAFRFD
ncbi:MAG TPA: ABC transporter permease [Planctomycetota bacterium]|nr:ABC transporter permease [Planctomycetota bacterium]